MDLTETPDAGVASVGRVASLSTRCERLATGLDRKVRRFSTVWPSFARPNRRGGAQDVGG